MFPCSSIYLNNSKTNQTMLRVSNRTIQNGDIYNHRNPISSSNPNYHHNHSQLHKVINEPSNGQSSWKRSVKKKDRHSKISTAQGVRDRRIRLSLQIARKFFDLQDMLGFDKASATIDWLFNKSKSAIRELEDSLSPPDHHRSSSTTTMIIDSSDGHDDIKKKKRLDNKPVVARESRDKARARARERTREKLLERSRQSSYGASLEIKSNNNDSEAEYLGFLDQFNWDNSMIVDCCSSKLIYSKRLSFSVFNPFPILKAESGDYLASDSQLQNPNLASEPRNPSPIFMPYSLNIAENIHEKSDVFMNIPFV